MDEEVDSDVHVLPPGAESSPQLLHFLHMVITVLSITQGSQHRMKKDNEMKHMNIHTYTYVYETHTCTNVCVCVRVCVYICMVQMHHLYDSVSAVYKEPLTLEYKTNEMYTTNLQSQTHTIYLVLVLTVILLETDKVKIARRYSL